MDMSDLCQIPHVWILCNQWARNLWFQGVENTKASCCSHESTSRAPRIKNPKKQKTHSIAPTRE